MFFMRGSAENERRAFGWILAVLVVLLGMAPPVTQIRELPDSISLTKGYSSQWSFLLPIESEVSEEDQRVLSSTDQTLSDVESQVSLTGRRTGEARVQLKLMGLLPIKTVQVNVQPERLVVPGGQSIGVALKTQGVLVVGTSDLGGSVASPAREAGVRSGDLIERVNGVEVEDAKHLSSLINEAQDAAMLTVMRQNRQVELTIRPAYDDHDGVFRLGAWVRDSTAGVGTLSFYDPTTQKFGALGHPITDVDTGELLRVREGEILRSTVVKVRQGQKGDPGELMGQFLSDPTTLGRIYKNGEFGIYGDCVTPPINPLYPDGLPVSTRNEVKLGKATLLTTLDGGGVREFACEITRLNHQDSPSPRSMVIEVTDPELLSRTGGIVQGMSGSPILQDGRVVGCVTHVYVNDPTQGFGIYIDWMLEQCEN